MLRDPELRELYHSLTRHDPFSTNTTEIAATIADIVTATSLLLRVLDKHQDTISAHLHDYEAILKQMGNDIAELQAHTLSR